MRGIDLYHVTSQFIVEICAQDTTVDQPFKISISTQNFHALKTKYQLYSSLKFHHLLVLSLSM